MITLIVAAAILLVVIAMSTRGAPLSEGFLVADPATMKAQRQQLQFEGERRQNKFAQLQSPSNLVSPDDVRAAVSQTVAVPTSNTASMLTLLSTSLGLGALDPGTNKVGTLLEQTGVVQQKINFCESITTVNCDQLDDPRMAECGFCHRDGTNSLGKGHRGGLYISADDQIRANEASNRSGAPAIYQPTIGSCRPENFTLVKENCQVRELQLTCQSAGAATAANQCGQCYGAAPAGATGLLYMGPKPLEHAVTLTVSHPGLHANNGVGTVITYSNGYQITLPFSEVPDCDPKSVTLTVKEGDVLTITVYGTPRVWCGWLSGAKNPNRYVSLDVGEQSIQPAAWTIAGDKNSGPVAAMVQRTPAAASWIQGVPATVLWYERRDDLVPGSVVSAYYGNTSPDQPGASGTYVTDWVKQAAGSGQAFTVSNDYFGGDPDQNVFKHVWITLDNGQSVIAGEGQQVTPDQISNVMTMTFQMPATLVDPIFSDDMADCPTGPLVLTETGAALMGSHSCFGAGGAFNPSQYCMQELFQAAGGTQQGTDWPNSDTKAAALAVNGSLDDTMAALNSRADIALYGRDAAGNPVDYPTLVDASMRMTGRSPHNPCDTPNAATGPHTADCLDYLWRTAGTTQYDSANLDANQIPYGFCAAAGTSAPLNADGSPNVTTMGAANAQGSVTAVRQYYQNIYNQASNTSLSFSDQQAAVAACYNAQINVPPASPSECPPPSADEWHCVQPNDIPAWPGIGVTAIPAIRRTPNGVTCASQDGTNCSMFPSIDACQTFRLNPTGTQEAKPPAAVSTPFTAPGSFVHNMDNGLVGWTSPGSNIVHGIPSCDYAPGVCDSGNWASSLPDSQFSAQFTYGPNVTTPDHGSFVDDYIRQRV